MTEQERKDWIEVAGMLGLRVDYRGEMKIKSQCPSGFENIVYMACSCDAGVAILHGLACLEVNGCAQRMGAGLSLDWYWEVYHRHHGLAATHPAALLAMLKAHRENNSRPPLDPPKT
jgi:hypothetical protein